VESAPFQKELQKLIVSIVLEDDAQLEEINGEIDGGVRKHPHACGDGAFGAPSPFMKNKPV